MWRRSVGLRWRPAEGAWRELEVPVVARDGHAMAWVGETDCWSDEIPLSTLEAGIDLKVTVELTDRSSQEVDLGRVRLPPR